MIIAKSQDSSTWCRIQTEPFSGKFRSAPLSASAAVFQTGSNKAILFPSNFRISCDGQLLCCRNGGFLGNNFVRLSVMESLTEFTDTAAEMMPSYLFSGIPGAMSMGYAYYYKNYCGQVPEIFAGEGPFLDLLRETCPILKEEYRPPPLVHESRLMTIVASLGRHRGLSFPFMREVFQTSDGGEIALDWWDARLQPQTSAEVPVVPSSLLDSLTYYYNSLPHLRLPELQIPKMRLPDFQIPYFGPLKRSASATGTELSHLESVASDLSSLAQDITPRPESHEDTVPPDYQELDDADLKDSENQEFLSSHDGDVITFKAGVVDSHNDLDYDEEFPMENILADHVDGGILTTENGAGDKSEASKPLVESLDAAAGECVLSPPTTVPEPIGIVIVLPGLTGDSTRNYVQGLVQVVEQLGYTVVVMNFRGATGNLKACFMADTTDVAEVIRHLKQRYPTVPVLAIGVSLGGIILTNYLARCGRENVDSLLLGVMTVSVAWNFFESAKTLEEPLNWLLFNRMLTRALCDAVEKHSNVLEKAYDLAGLKSVRTLRQFDNELTAKMFGFSNADEYYKSATLHDKIHTIKTPLLALNAGDDVFSPYAAIPKEDAMKNPNLCILVTSHGGHIGFLEGRNPFGTNYVERVFQQFAKTMFENKDRLTNKPVVEEGVTESLLVVE